MNTYVKNIVKLLRDIRHLPNTIYFNFTYFPFHTAIHLPVFVSANVRFVTTRGRVILKAPIQHRMIRFGFGHVGIFDQRNSKSIWEVTGTVQFNGRANIGHGSKLCVAGNLTLGDNFSITAESQLICFDNIVFGDDCLLSWQVLVMDTDFHKIYNEAGKQINSNRQIRIGNKNWIGCRSLILKGATTPNNCIVAANSTVTHSSMLENTILAGSPAEVIREHISWEV